MDNRNLIEGKVSSSATIVMIFIDTSSSVSDLPESSAIVLEDLTSTNQEAEGIWA